MGAITKVWDFLLPLVSERNDKGEYKRASLGRVSFWIVFGIAVYVWTAGTGDIQPSHLQMLYITATYNLMKKATFFGNINTKTGDSEITIEHEREEDPAPRI
jgi:hypothetical protein